MWRGPVLRTDALFAVSLSSSDGENQNDHLHPAGPAAPCFFSTPCRKNGPNGERIMLESEYIGVAGAAGIWHAWAEAANAFRGRSASAVRIGNTQHREMTMIQRWGQKFPNRRSRRLRHVFFASVIFAFTPGRAHPQVLRWIDAKSLAIEGKGWADTKRYYDRLPRQAEGVVRQPVWDLSHDSAGMLIHFASDTPELQVRWTLTSAFLAAPNMSASGMSGLDLYVRFDGGLHWLAAVRPGASREGNAGVLFENIPVERREFLLYLPLCNGIESLQLGIPESRKLEPVVRSGEPLVFYGTSIVQGGCVMRPGMAYPAILGRRLDRAIINLGFSGNGRAEPEMASFLAELDPAAYVLDCLPNLGGNDVERLEVFVNILRQRHPATPIFLVENLEYPDGIIIPARKMSYEKANQTLHEIYTRLSRTDGNLHYFPGRNLIGTDGEATVDGVHPTDLGAMRMADQMEPALRQALAD